MGRYLGQHFLINKDKVRKIVEALGLKDGDVIIEIGPGHGELTKELVNKFISLKINKFKIIAIEKDKKLVEILRNKMALPYREAPCPDKAIVGVVGAVEVIEGDALRILSKITNDLQLTTNDYKIVGNIPYYITGYLLRILGELEHKPSLIVLTIQKEVAERVCAKVGKMNLLAASVQFWAKPEIVDFISKKDFKPMPKVDSAIIRLAIRVQPLATRENADKYYQFIRILFKQPRKTISNNLLVVCCNAKYANTRECREEIIKKLRKLGIDPQARPQDLSIEQIKELLTLF